MGIISALLGLCIGSFIDVAYCRFAPDKNVIRYLNSIAFTRSKCVHCQKNLAIWQLIPVISWCCLQGRCYYCGRGIGVSSLMVELVTACLFTVIVTTKGINLDTVIILILACWFILVALIDYKHYLLPDFLTQPLMWSGIMLAYFNFAKVSLDDALIGILCGYLLLQIPASLFYLVTKRIGLGQGDVKLLAALGSWISYQKLPLLLIIASILGLVYYGLLRFGLHRRSITLIPFGPFILMAGFWLYSFC